MTRNVLIRGLAGLAAVALAAPALAQDEAPEKEDDYSLTIGVGGGITPSYEGSDNYDFTPIGAVFGKVAGFGFQTRGTGLSLDLVPDGRDAPFSIELGPLVHVRLDRTRGIKDPQVLALGEIDTAIEVGGVAGLTKNGIFHQYDSFGVRLSVQKDVTNTHGSTIVTPAIEYSTPLSEKTLVQLSVQAERVGEGYADTYFSITPAGALASGLPAFDADGGWKNIRTSLFFAQSLTGELRDPEWSLFAIASWSRLRGDFKDSPIVSIAGDADQLFGLVGVSYTF